MCSATATETRTDREVLVEMKALAEGTHWTKGHLACPVYEMIKKTSYSETLGRVEEYEDVSRDENGIPKVTKMTYCLVGLLLKVCDTLSIVSLLKWADSDRPESGCDCEDCQRELAAESVSSTVDPIHWNDEMNESYLVSQNERMTSVIRKMAAQLPEDQRIQAIKESKKARDAYDDLVRWSDRQDLPAYNDYLQTLSLDDVGVAYLVSKIESWNDYAATERADILALLDAAIAAEPVPA